MVMPHRRRTLANCLVSSASKRLQAGRLNGHPFRLSGHAAMIFFASTLLLRFWCDQNRNAALQRQHEMSIMLHNQQKQNSTQNAVETEYTIFYHVYIPESEDGQVNALRIIEEQLQQVSESYAATNLVTIFYNTVDKRNVLSETLVDDLCRKKQLNCQRMNHYDQGLEALTIQSLYEHCQSPPPQQSVVKDNHDFRRVVYMHNKGSHHHNKINERWRQLMTYAVTSEMCLNPPDDQCNACGLYFAAERGFFFPGNFWAAQCDYIQKLSPPKDYEEKSNEIMKDALLLNLRNQFVMDLSDFSIENYGVDRYAAELWAASHPSVVPCDLSLGKRETFGFGHSHPFFEWLLEIPDPLQRTHKTLPWSMAPSLPMERLPWRVRWSEATRIREYALLGGNLYKWFKLYHEAPPPSSWIWKWFPDGDKWKQAVDEHGENAVEMMTKAYMDT